ncbi:zinc-dependent alcohol dehydrogenase family protein [Rhizobium sp. P32RR-XVIII]|uniref:zinc-dependent alcohol dehydrogenase family protein n=1 Tax=Rhizobium sp. P32RR-XVIII TaxID=2726738 RepID=UPI001456374F|nr:zinc-dependent alcohol dehydrogenase family protein [Rhizobium sp. P32RR-XVIII]NLS03274.1 zinc-dependent alcohol dehydrogenase family protein [Rhizobium sp. P32RR-XVIII]
MKSMVLDRIRTPLRLVELPDPRPAAGQLVIRVEACGVCRTDLHVFDGDLPNPKLPLVLGHEIVGTVEAVGEGAPEDLRGRRVGVPWLGHTCGSCPYCRSGRENLCDDPGFTGYTLDGGFATHVVADAPYAFVLPDGSDPVATAPLLCAGLIGWRSLKMAGDGKAIGLYGFGAAAHILVQVCRWRGQEVYAFTRPDDEAGRRFAMEQGAVWAGSSTETHPLPLDAAILFAPAGELVPQALAAVRKGGTVVCGGIHMSDIPAMPYRLLWGERRLVSVANLTRSDAQEFFGIAKAANVRTVTSTYPLERANEALEDLRAGRLNGAAVIVP